MNFRKSLVVVLMGLGCAAVARAQVGVYIGYTATRFSGIPCSLTSTVACDNGAQPGAKNYVNPSGVQFGGYYDFKTVGPVRLGLDLRGGDFHANKSATTSAGGKNTVGLDDVLLGVRGSFHTKYTWLSPYVQLSGGYAKTDATLVNPTSRRDNFVIYEVFAGVDLHVFPLIDLRPIELGIGNMNQFGTSNGSLTDSVGVKSIGAAIVFHTPIK